MRLIDKCFCFAHLDYITKSYDAVDHYFDLGLQAYEPFHVIDEIRAAPHYHKAYKLQCGAVLNMSDDTRQGCKLDIGGDALWHIRAVGKKHWSDEFILKMLATKKHKRTTRLDFAFNIVGAGNPRQIRRLIDNGKYNGRLKPAPSVNTPGQTRGETVYFGSKDAAFRVRVYDKAAEMGDLWLAWTRCEAQFRDEYAQNATIDAANNVPLADHTRTKMQGSVGTFHLHWWKRMMQGELAEVSQLRRKESKFEARMEQLRGEILTKASASKEQLSFIVNEWLPDLANGLLKLQGD